MILSGYIWNNLQSLILLLAPACPVKFFEEKEQSEFNRGSLLRNLKTEKLSYENIGTD
jgi:hypothetical protein